MNTHHEMSHEEIVRARLEVLKREHRDLDEAIAALSAQNLSSSLTLQRLKKQKLGLKDRIATLEKLATDPGRQLSDEIEKLRSLPPRKPAGESDRPLI